MFFNRKIFLIGLFLLIFSEKPWIVFSDEEGAQKTKQKEDQQSFVPYEKAKEMAEYERYLQEKQNAQENTRNVTSTSELMKQIKQGKFNKKETAKEEQQRLQEQFAKDRLKNLQEAQKRDLEDRTRRENRKEQEEIKVTRTPPPPEMNEVGPLEQEIQRMNRLYEMRITMDYRAVDRKTQEELLMFKEEKKEHPAYQEKDAIREDILNNVPFIREITLSPYAFEEKEFEK